MTRTAFVSLFALVFSAFAFAGELPRKAGPLTLKTTSGDELNLASLKGKVVAVMFFSTDCPHCQSTAELLGPVYAEYKPKGVEIMALAVNPSAAANLGEFISKHKVKFPIGLTTRSTWDVFAGLSVMSRHYVPHLLIVDKDGNIREDHPGEDRAFWGDQEAKLRATFDALK